MKECGILWGGDQNQGAPSFSTLIFCYFSMTKKMKIHDLSAQRIFPSKRYTTYEWIPELVVTVPSARSTTVKKIKRFIIWLHKWSCVTFTELLSAVVKIPWHYHHFPWLFHDFPGPLLFSMTFHAWKMVFLNSINFRDQGAPCLIVKPGYLYVQYHVTPTLGENSDTIGIPGLLVSYLLCSTYGVVMMIKGCLLSTIPPISILRWKFPVQFWFKFWQFWWKRVRYELQSF